MKLKRLKPIKSLDTSVLAGVNKEIIFTINTLYASKVKLLFSHFCLIIESDFMSGNRLNHPVRKKWIVHCRINTIQSVIQISS